MEGKRRASSSTSMKKCQVEVRRHNYSTIHITRRLCSRVKSSSGSLMLIMLGPRRIKLCGMTPRCKLLKLWTRAYFKPKGFIQILILSKVYHFHDANACFVKNPEDDTLENLKKLPIIFRHRVFDIRKTSMEKLEVHVQCLHWLQHADRAKCEATWKIRLEL